MDGRQECYSKLHYGIAKPSNEALCKEEVSSQDLQLEIGIELGTRPPKLLLGQCSVQEGYDLLLPYCKEHSLMPLRHHTQRRQLPFLSARMAEHNGPVFLQVSRSLDLLSKLTKG